MVVKNIAIFTGTWNLPISKNVLHGVGWDTIWVPLTILLWLPIAGLLGLYKAHAIMTCKSFLILKLPRSILLIIIGYRYEQIVVIIIVITLVIIINDYFFCIKRWPFHVKALTVYLLSYIFEIGQEIILT